MNNTEYQRMRRLYEERVARITDNFTIEDTGLSYMLNHRRLPLTIVLPTALERGATSHVNMMAPLSGEESPESMVSVLRELTGRRDLLRQRGYQQFERFERYDDGAEMVYDLPTESEDDLTRIVRDFDFSEVAR